MTHNVDDQEIAKFAQHAAHWWDPKGPLRTLHTINPVRLDYILSKTALDGKKVIDIGCGGGILTESMARAGATVTGIDMNKDGLTIAQLHQLESGLTIHYAQQTAEAFAQEAPEQFEVVTCLEMLEHVPDPASIVSACARLAKPGGYIFFSTLNRNVKSYLVAILGAEYVLKLLPKNTHDFAHFIRPAELGNWIRSGGLTIKEFKGLTYNPLTHQARLSDDISVNYLAYAQKPE